MFLQRDRPRRLFLLGFAAAAGAVAGCSDLERSLGYVFPPTVPGLASDAAWVSLPVGVWMTEGGYQAQAISACFASACSQPIAVGVFRARNRETVDASRILRHPTRLQDLLRHDERPPAAKGRPRPSVDVDVARVDEPGIEGVTVRMARTDGTRPAFGIMFAPKLRAYPDTLVVIVGPSEAGAMRVARDVAARLS